MKQALIWLTFSLLALLLVAGTAGAADHAYVGVKKCKSCHKKEAIGNQYGKWAKSKHAKAYDTLGSDKAKEYAKKAGIADPQKNGKCLKCHVTAYGAAAELVSKKFDSKDGVQCESCHGAGKDYRKKKIMKDLDLAKSKGLIIPEAKDCAVCHNDKSPAWDQKKFKLAGGGTSGFDFEQAKKAIEHPIPEGYDPNAKKGK